MRRPLLVVRRLAALLLSLVLLVLAVAAGLVWLTLPGGDRIAAIPGLSAPVDIELDADGIPRIHAATELDAAAALGWLHARERLFQMDLMRRAASGELSEIAGRATLPIDRLMRTLGVRRSALADLQSLPAATRTLLDAYAAGVNAWIAERGRLSSLEFLVFGAPRPWAAVDSLLWGKTMGLYLSGNWRTELARLSLDRRLPPQQVDELWPTVGGSGPQANAASPPELARVAGMLAAALPRFPDPFTLPAQASNEWAVDGRHSASGAPLLAGDPHLGFSLPAIWYLARIETPAAVLAGASAPGVPSIVIGHNNRIAWTFTTTGADTQDLFIETQAGDGLYQTPDGPRAFAVRQERIAIRGGDAETLVVRETRHGPVISDLVDPHGPLLALSMANLSPGDQAAEGLLALNRASDVAAAGRAGALISSPVQNLLVADRDHIGLFVTGRVPVRRQGDGARPAPGADGSHDWIGWASGEQLPHYLDPPSGRLVNANDRIAPPEFAPFLGRDWYGDWRARRIRALLEGRDHHTVADFAAMQTDVVSLVATDLLPRLRQVPPSSPASKAALALLAHWDGSMARALSQPLIFNAWMQRFHAALLARSSIPPMAAGPWPEFVRFVLTPPGAHWCGSDDCTEMLSASLASAMADLVARYGADLARWRWGTAHPAVFADPMLRAIPALDRLTEARIDSPGADATLDRGGIRPSDSAVGFGRDAFVSVHGASFRGVYDLADLDRSVFVVAPGQSGHLFSRLARNFVQRWRDGGTVTLGPRAEYVAARIRLTPQPGTNR